MGRSEEDIDPFEWTAEVSIYVDERDAFPNIKAFRLGVLFGQEHEQRDQKSGNAFAPAIYDEGARRGNKNVRELSLLVLEFDHLTGEEERRIRDRCKRFAHVFYTTWSDDPSGEKGRCFRLVLLVWRPILPSEFASLWHTFNEEFCMGLADGQAKDLARIYYLPSCPRDRGADARIVYHRGPVLDPDDFSGPPPGSKSKTRAPKSKKKKAKGDHGGVSEARASRTPLALQGVEEGHRDDELFRYVNRLHAKGLCQEEGRILATVAARRCKPPFPDNEVLKKVEKAWENGDATDDSQAEKLIALVAHGHFFHGSDHTAYVRIPIDGHDEIYRLRSQAFARRMQGWYYRSEGGPPAQQALDGAINVLEAQARFDGPLQAVSIRVGGDDEVTFVDLGDPTWSAIRVTAEGWTIEPRPQANLYRAEGLRALPMPERGGNLGELRSLLNAREDSHWYLMLAWMLAAFRPSSPYPILVLHGEQGSAKTTVARILRSLLDPAASLLRSPPREERDLMISASRSWIMAFDNVSVVRESMADVLCRLATGGGFSTRQLYTDADEVMFEAMRPVVLTGIEGLVARHDLADRTILLRFSQDVCKRG